mgnify:CR=1 FL=1
MTYTFSNFPVRDRMNDRLVREVTCAGPASYVTGGDDLDFSDELGLGTVFGVYGHLSDGTTILQLWWDYTNQKLKMFVTSSDAEVANGVDLSTFVGTLLITGK